MIKIYTASKLASADIWNHIQRSWPEVYCHARWLKHVSLLKTPDTPENASRFWIEDLEDVESADALVVYAAQAEHLRGALVEVGIALGARIPVYVIGTHPDYGTWQYHPLVRRVPSFEELQKQLRLDFSHAYRP